MKCAVDGQIVLGENGGGEGILNVLGQGDDSLVRLGIDGGASG